VTGGSLFSQAEKGTSLLSQTVMNTLRLIFNEADRLRDGVVERNHYVEKLKSDLRVIPLLELPAAELPIIKRLVTLREVLEIIQSDLSEALPSMAKSL